jgi:hypothetical protein
MTFSRRQIAAAMMLTLAAGVARADEWKTMTSDGGRFSLEMPGTPTEQKQTYDTPQGGQVEAVVYVLELQGGEVAYMAGYNDFSKDQLKGKKPAQLLNDARDGALDKVQGELLAETEVKLDGNPGRELKIQAGEMVVYVRVFLVKNRMIQALVAMPKDAVPEKDVNRFLQSIALLKKKARSK